MKIDGSDCKIHHDVDILNRDLMDITLKDLKRTDTYFGSNGPVLGIDRDQFKKFLSESKFRKDFAVIDLRWPEGTLSRICLR